MKTSKSKKIAASKPAAVKAPAAKASRKPAPVAARARVTTVKTTAKKPAVSAKTPHREITSEVIASRAFILWDQAGRPQGRDVEYWLQAEKQIKESSFAA